MQRVLWLLPCLVLLGLSYLRSQPSRFATSPGVSNALTRVLRTDGTVTAGLFIGLMEDSVSLVVGGKLQKISRHQMWRLTIERRAEPGKATLAGLLLGVYAGNIAFLRGENEPFAFMRNRSSNGSSLDILIDAGFALAGAGIGSLIGSSIEGEESFDFAESEEVNQTEWERLRVYVSGGESDRRFAVHISFQGAWVDTYLPNSEGNNYYGSGSVSGASNLNIMRKMQLALTLTPLVDGGIAVMWLGQPSSVWYSYSSSSSSNGSVRMTGQGYYALGILKPLHLLMPRNLQWDVGAGIGIASVEYNSLRYSYPYADTSRTPDMAIRKTLFSGVVYTEVKVFLSDYLSLGISGDYVFIPKKIPAIEEMKVESRGMGTASIGFVLGLHF